MDNTSGEQSDIEYKLQTYFFTLSTERNTIARYVGY